MRLKRVRIFGFKTFADRAEFDIDGGLVAVVGPNGCGKSNLVDAILWGLGEGTPRQLRAASSQDVIFNGSTKRKAVAFAEVSLLFDNEDGSLPVDTPEVVVSRKMTRSGESEYRINRTVCRQRDVYELLADTGLGRTGYAIVGQKEIDQALAASVEDRRAWVDEAAGVQRYRVRKNDALKRLAAAQQHLQRVSDLLRELEAQREPLREEAEVARKYRTAAEALRSMEVGLLAKEVVEAIAEIEKLGQKIESSHQAAVAEEKLADKSERTAQEISATAAAVERDIETLWSAQQRRLTAQERAEADLRLAEQRLESLAHLEQTLGSETESLESRLIEARSELHALSLEEESERTSLENLHQALGTVGQEASEATSALRSIENRLAEARALLAKKLRSEVEAEQTAERKRQLRREVAGIEATVPDLRVAVADAEKSLEQAIAAVQGVRAAIKDCDDETRSLSEAEEADAESLRTLLSDRAILEGRRKGIEATLETHEGMAQGARAILEAVRSGELPDCYTPVSEAVTADKRYALAIETALGAASNDLIVEKADEAERAIDWLKEHKAGRATFQPLSLVAKPSADAGAIVEDARVIGRAADLATCEARVRPVVESLLGRILIVASLDDALALAKTKGWSRLVTLDGDVLHYSGAVTGGRLAKGGYGIVQRKADLAELSKEISSLDREVEKLERSKEIRQAARAELLSKIEALRAEELVKAKEAEEAKDFRDSLKDELSATDRSLERAARELEALEALNAELIDAPDVAAVEAERDQALRRLAEATSKAEQADGTLRDAEARLTQAALRREACQKRVEAAVQDDTYRRRRLDDMEPERARIGAEIARCRETATETQKERADADHKLETLKAQRQGHIEEALRLGEEARQARANAAAIVQGAHQAELSRARAESKRATSLERLGDEYGLLLEDVLSGQATIEIPPDAATLVGRLRREIRAMGSVNVGAIEAYDRLTERCDELTAQRADIEGGVAEVRATIAELDKLTRERFLTTFDSVRAAFSELFTKLFAGGEAQLRLTMPDNVLESGIEIDVVLPGKKRQRLELLSGGERSLCACAFLFALLRVKPSPLVVLDEVDAPLDGRNVERFVQLLEEFQAITQFIVVTHNPTTIESSPVWLGVTMQEPGVSTLVPSRVPPKPVEPKRHAVVGIDPIAVPA